MADPKVGTGKKPKGSGRRLYTDENPKDTVSIKFATPTDAKRRLQKYGRLRNRLQEKFKSLLLENKGLKLWVKTKLLTFLKKERQV